MRKRIRLAIKSFQRNLVYALATFVFRQDRIVLYTSSQNDQYRNITFLAKELDRRSIPYTTLSYETFLRHIYCSLVVLARARILVIDASSPAAFVRLSKKTTLINCWHACGAYKKIAFDAKRKGFDSAEEERRIQRIHRSIAYFICSSEHTADVYSRAFRLPRARVKALGTPRIDGLVRACATMPKPPTPFTILFAPTFRTQQGQRTVPVPPWCSTAWKERLEDALGTHVRLAYRRHPSIFREREDEGWEGIWEDWSYVPQAHALLQTSLFITDYSSLFFDYLLLRRPILFYVPDLATYTAHERELYFSPYDAFPNTTCATEEELFACVLSCQKTAVDYSQLWETHMSACDGNSSQKICDFILSLLKE